MGKKFIKQFIIISTILFIGISSNATELKFGGSIGYNFFKDKVTIFADKIMNKGKSGKSGSIKVAIYATESLYESGGLYGYLMGEHTFDNQLYGDYHFTDVQQTVDYIEPPVGKYYITVALMEYDGEDYRIKDFQSFKDPVVFGIDAEMKKELELQREKQQSLAEKNKEKELEEKKKKETEYKFQDDLRTQTLLTVLILGGLRHMINVP
ncbi:MAG: hypothetical protein GY714_17405 [Desulfobacterales bacterium]|nr:hypothetical protein [Desulfobacterales bacterium]MCP4159434.1 hypothetical protein [Deltaproteobacteria bacterium]